MEHTPDDILAAVMKLDNEPAIFDEDYIYEIFNRDISFLGDWLADNHIMLEEIEDGAVALTRIYIPIELRTL